MTLKLYDRTTIADLPWPPTTEGAYAQRVLQPLVEHGPQRFIDNAYGDMRVLLADGAVLPLLISDGAQRQPKTYVCSPTTHYVDYALREIELELGDQPLLRMLAGSLLRACRPWLRRAHFDRVVYVNNWLLSTNLYPPLTAATLDAIVRYLIGAFPQHAIVFRSVSDSLNAALLDQLQALHLRPVFSRQVYLLDPHDRSYAQKKSFRKDVALARRTPYTWQGSDEVGTNHVERWRELYSDVYLHKYSWLNPQFNTRFMRAVLLDGWLTSFALSRSDRIDGVLGFVERHGVMTAPLIGYDRWLPASLGLYRLISLKLVEEARERGLILHQSSGAAQFKRHRGSTPSIEYNLIYDAHLRPHARLPWHMLGALTRRVIVPLVRRYEL